MKYFIKYTEGRDSQDQFKENKTMFRESIDIEQEWREFRDYKIECEFFVELVDITPLPE